MIYFDMDGVLAVWDVTASEEDTHKPGYFYARKCEKSIAALIRLLISMGEGVRFLTHVYRTGTARADKACWLHKQGFGNVPVVFVPYGEDKAAYIAELGRGDVLIDDYSDNLRKWQRTGAKAIKFFNGINGTKGTWTGPSISRDMTPEDMAAVIIAVRS